jgi:hypothetical protein
MITKAKNFVMVGVTIAILAMSILSVVEDADAKKNRAKVTCVNGSCTVEQSGDGDKNEVTTSSSSSGSSVTIKQSNED